MATPSILDRIKMFFGWAPPPSPVVRSKRATAARVALAKRRTQAGFKDQNPPSLVLPWWWERKAGRGTNPDEVKTLLVGQLHQAAAECDGPRHELLRKLAEFCTKGDPSLPVFPDVAVKLDRLLRHGDPSISDVTSLVSRDPELVRRTLQVASTAALGRAVPDLGRAVTRLGLEGLWRVAMGAIVHSPVFRVPRFQDEAMRARRISLAAGEIAAELCLDPDERGLAFLIGVLHEVGTLQILRQAASVTSSVPPAEIRSVVAEYSGAIGAMVARSWTLLDASVATTIASLGSVNDEHASLVARSARAGQIAAQAAVVGGLEPDRWSNAIRALYVGMEPDELLGMAIQAIGKHNES